MIGKIAVSAAAFAIDKPYSYRIPQGMTLMPGQRVQLPFGNGNRTAEGIVLSVEEGPEDGLKSVETVLDAAPLLTQNQLRLAAFMRERYFCTMYDAVRAMLPAGLWFREKATVSLTQDRSWQEKKPRKPGAVQLLNALLELGGSARDTELARFVPSEEERGQLLAYLLRKKWVTARKELLPRGSDKTEKVVTLSVEPEQAMAFAATRGKAAQMQKSVLELLCSVGSGSAKDICYYTGASNSTLKRLETLGYVVLTDRPVLRCSQICPAKIDGPLILNDEQQHCFDGLQAQMDSKAPGSALLYGVTGSGKTAVYIRLIRHALDMGKAAVLLVPEIALTPQLLSQMAAWFGDQVAVLHSSLAAGERYDQWNRVRSGSAKVVIGTRSAIFAPCENPGIIILDEEQEHSYQSENSPRYDAREVALWRGIKEGALVLFGSATPSVATMYRARTGHYTLYTLSSRYNGRPLPEVEIVDLREELKMGNDLSLSYPLRQAMYDNQQVGQQTVLLLNRRGNSRALVCVDCRQAPECPRCSVRMTYHSANNRLMCHYCGYSMPVPKRCPKCGGPLKPMGTGTQKVVQELEQLYPDMRIARMDTDTVSASNTHEMILSRFQEENQDVLVGTQMVAKGLNLPKVTLVGVLDADLGLYSSGYLGAETTFNMLTQVVGRAGRGEIPGRAVIQTLLPDHQVINLAAKQDYDGFYELELRLRQLQKTPPFGDVLTVVFQGQEETLVLRSAVGFRDALRAWAAAPELQEDHLQCLGPAPCPVPKINFNYRYRLTVNCRLSKSARQVLAQLLREFSKNRANRGISVYIDVNGPD